VTRASGGVGYPRVAPSPVVNSGNGASNLDAGDKGVVIIRHSSEFSIATTTGSPTVTNSGGYIIYTFNDSGSITWS
jgi:hypothetical protein